MEGCLCFRVGYVGKLDVNQVFLGKEVDQEGFLCGFFGKGFVVVEGVFCGY